MGKRVFLDTTVWRIEKRKTRSPRQSNVIVTPFAATIVIDVGEELKTVELMMTESFSEFADAFVSRRIRMAASMRRMGYYLVYMSITRCSYE